MRYHNGEQIISIYYRDKFRISGIRTVDGQYYYCAYNKRIKIYKGRKFVYMERV